LITDSPIFGSTANYFSKVGLAFAEGFDIGLSGCSDSGFQLQSGLRTIAAEKMEKASFLNCSRPNI